jgi:hypothetical protein
MVVDTSDADLHRTEEFQSVLEFQKATWPTLTSKHYHSSRTMKRRVSRGGRGGGSLRLTTLSCRIILKINLTA